jgi:hypothetical protein
MSKDCSIAAIKYALDHHCDGGIDFLRCWFHGDFNAIRKEWSDAPDAVFVGADPLHRDTLRGAYETAKRMLAGAVQERDALREQLAEARREAAEAQARLRLLDKQYTRMQLSSNHPHTHQAECDIFIRALRPQKCGESALQSAIEQVVAPYREQVSTLEGRAVLLTENVRMLVEAVELALSSHGVLLMSDPPQDAWKFRGVDAKLRAALATVKGEQA